MSDLVARLRVAGCVFAEEEAELLLAAAATPVELAAMVERRLRGMPLQHILGWAEFCGMRFTVAPGVFIPRARTELLVREAVALVDGPQATVVDVCCGSGAVGAAIATITGGVRLYAVDIDQVAVDCARENLAPVGGQVYRGDLCAPLPDELRGRVEVLVANVPYVPAEALSSLLHSTRFEPLETVHGGADGLDVLRRLVAQAPDWLAPLGHLLVETSRGQAPAAAELMGRAGIAPRIVRDEQLGANAIIAARRSR